MTGTERTAPGASADYCSRWPGEPHAFSVHIHGGALVSVRRCDLCGWIDFNDLDEQVRKITGDTTIEHGQRYSGGAVLVRYESPAVERVYPLTEWIEASQHHGEKVLRRTVIVVEDWHEVPGP